MQAEFWHNCWETNRIAFHSREINHHLQSYWPILDVTQGSRVFVPLCGKSNDMLWLLARGYQVVGTELSQKAVSAFFAENNLQPHIQARANFISYEVEGLQILCGNFFNLTPALLGEINAVYDRAALVALPPEMRAKYAQKMAELLNAKQKILLITFEYNQQEMAGPPFSVTVDEIERLYAHHCRIETLLDEEVLARETSFKARGLNALREAVYQLTVY